MAKQPCASDADDKPVYKSVFIATSLQTYLAVMVSSADTVSELKNKIEYEHPLCFSNFGNIKIEAIKVNFRGQFHHLSQSMILDIAFDGFCKKRWFAYADVSVLPHDAPTHQFLLPDSNVKNTVVSHHPCDRHTSLSNFNNGAEPSTYDHDQILLDISSPEKQGHSVDDYKVPSVRTRSEVDESGRQMSDSQLKVCVEENANVVSFAKKQKIKHFENSSGNLPKEILQLHTSSIPDAGRETVADNDGIKKGALSWKNTYNVDGDIEEYSLVKPSNIGEEVGASADENKILDHCQEVKTFNDKGAEEGKKIAQKQDSKPILSEVIKPSDDYDLDLRMNQTSGFLKHSDTIVTVEPKKSICRRKNLTAGLNGAILDGLVEGCMSKGEGVLTEFDNSGYLGQSSKIGDKQKEILIERQEENARREVIPAKYNGKGAANQKGNVYEKDGELEKLNDCESDIRMNRNHGFSKHSDTIVTVEPKKSSRRRKKKTEGPNGAILDGLVEGCMSKGEGVLTEFDNLGDLGQSSKIGDEQNEILIERQEENARREVIPAAKYNGKGAANQKGNVYEIDSELEKLNDCESDIRMNRNHGFSKHSDTNLTVEPKKSSGAILDGLVEECMPKSEGVSTEFDNLGDLSQSSKIGDEQKEILIERQEENARREVIPTKYKGKGATNQKGNVYEKDGGLEQLNEDQEVVESKDQKKKSKRCRASESKIPDDLRKDGGIDDNSSEDHHNRILVEGSKSKTIVGENRSHTVQASKPKVDQKLEAILISHSNLEASTKLACKHKNWNHRLSLDKLNPAKTAFGSVFGLNQSGKKRSLLATSGPIFEDGSSESLGDEDQSYRSNWSTRTPSENSLSSAYSDGESNADSLIDKVQENGESLAIADLSNKKAMTIENVLRSSKRYKKAKLIASQMEDTEKETPGFIPDSQTDI